MSDRDLLYALLLFLSSIITVVTGVFIWRRRTAPGARGLLMMGVAITCLLVFYGISWIDHHPQSHNVWLVLAIMSALPLPTLLLIFVFEYLQNRTWLTRGRMALLAVHPVVTWIIILTNPWHGLYFGDNPVSSTLFEFGGIWFLISAVYVNALAFIAIWLLMRAYRNAQPFFRQHIRMIVITVMLPWVAHMMNLAGLDPLPDLALSTLTFAVTGVMLAYNLFYAHLLDVVPLARSILVENMQEGVMVLDSLNRIVDINPTARHLIGLPDGGGVGQKLEGDLAQLMAVNGLDTDGLQTHIEWTTRGYPPRHYDVKINPLLDSQQRFLGRLVTWHDITERKNAELEREQLISDLDAYAHRVAHDLKNPVHVLFGYTELLIDTEDLNTAEAHEMLARIQRYNRILWEIIDELLLLSSVREIDTVQMEPLDMGVVVRDALQRLDSMVIEKAAEISLPQSWLSARGYRPWVEGVWVNYLSNALKYGGTPPRITLGSEPNPQGGVRYWIRDNGNGLTAQEQEQLFKQYERLGRVDTDGHGLGLSIVQRAVEKMGGSTGVQSEPGKGSLFYFTLP